MIRAVLACFTLSAFFLAAAWMLRKTQEHAPKGGTPSAPRGRVPLSERGCRAVLRVSAWLLWIGTAWDAGILRYRLEKSQTVIEMDSTREREFQVRSVA